MRRIRWLVVTFYGTEEITIENDIRGDDCCGAEKAMGKKKTAHRIQQADFVSDGKTVQEHQGEAQLW
jgi:hypothetical protein